MSPKNLPPKFLLETTFKFDDNRPRATEGSSVEVIEILDAPRGRPKVVIVERSYAMAHPFTYVCHFYDSVDHARRAFAFGLLKALKRQSELAGESPKDVHRTGM